MLYEVITRGGPFHPGRLVRSGRLRRGILPKSLSDFGGTIQAEEGGAASTKSEARNPKQIQISQCLKPQARRGFWGLGHETVAASARNERSLPQRGRFCIWELEFVSDFDIRIFLVDRSVQKRNNFV